MKRTKKFLAFSLLLLGLSSAGMTNIVHAADHEHTFTNDVCTCGAYTFEAEKGNVGGKTSDTGDDGFFIWRKSSNSRPTSGPATSEGGANCVANWANAGNTISWSFSLNQAASVPMHLWNCTGNASGYNLDNELELTLNGKKVNWVTEKTGIFPGGDAWYNWTIADTVNANFIQGLNKIVLTNKNGNPINIDNLVVDFPTTAIVGEPVQTFKFEAEDGDLHGTPMWGNSTFLGGDASCSGGACIENFGGGDNQIFWYFNLSKAVKKAIVKFYVYVAPTTGITDPDRAMWVEINDYGKWEAASDTLPNFIENDWLNFQPVQMKECELNQGSNTIKLEGYAGQPVNVDYMELTIYGDSELTVLDKPVAPEYKEEHKFIDGRCSECGAYSFEAENAIVEGRTSDPNEGFILERSSTNNRPTSGGKCIGNFSVAGNKIVWNIQSDKAVNNVNITIYIAPCGAADVIDSVVSLTYNENKVTFNQSTFPGFPGGDSWYNWTPLTGTISLIEGDNEIVFTNINGAPFNVDNIIIEAGKEVTLTAIERDRTAPTLSPIRIVTQAPMTYEKIEISFEYEDNETAKEDLVVNVVVYYNYGSAGQEKLDVAEDYSFVATEAGEYRIFVTITDIEENKVTKSRIMFVTENPNPPVLNPIEPSIPIPPSTPTRLNDTQIASIVLGSVVLLGIGCAVYAFIAYRLKMRG